MADIEKIEQALREGLEGVTPGEWEAGSGWVFVEPKDGYRTSPLRHILRDVPADEIQANCDYIAAARPENIRALLDELSRLREVEHGAKELERIGGMLANAAYNLAQANLPRDQRQSLREGQEAWDAAVCNYRAARALSERKEGQANG